MRNPSLFLRGCLGMLVIGLIVSGYFAYRWLRHAPDSGRMTRVWRWLQDPEAHPEWRMSPGQQCAGAPFIFPTDGFVGFLWDDSFRVGHRHQGIDIFGGQDVGITPVIAAYSGYLSRLADWKSSLIIRIPDDPLHPGRQIWTYYTHLADADGTSYIAPGFPPGTTEVYVEAGTLLGYQGNYSGDPYNPTGVHLHFSIVLDDGQGSFRNELEIRNTLDPSAYLGLPLNGKQNQGELPVCGGGTPDALP